MTLDPQLGWVGRAAAGSGPKRARATPLTANR